MNAPAQQPKRPQSTSGAPRKINAQAEEALAYSALVAMVVVGVASIGLIYVDTTSTIFYAKDVIGVWPTWLFVGLFLWCFTTGLEFGISQISYTNGSFPYVSGLGAWAYLLSRVRGSESDWLPKQSFEAIYREIGGLAWVSLFFYPAMIFDTYTDFMHLSRTPAGQGVILWIGTAASMFAEQGLALFFLLLAYVRRSGLLAKKAPAVDGEALERYMKG